MEIIDPATNNLTKVLGATFNRFLRTNKYININITAKLIRYHTSGMASIEIRAPSIAVKPQINTIKWSKA